VGAIISGEIISLGATEPGERICLLLRLLVFVLFVKTVVLWRNFTDGPIGDLLVRYEIMLAVHFTCLIWGILLSGYKVAILQSV
jgi:hypothetical protein